ncbi:hypothetical protein HOY80DRAFT_975990 [Tuber brumale]|nr:hypothetical protein HOY80DRAFT_975990 [Tuber brumale]
MGFSGVLRRLVFLVCFYLLSYFLCFRFSFSYMETLRADLPFFNFVAGSILFFIFVVNFCCPISYLIACPILPWSLSVVEILSHFFLFLWMACRSFFIIIVLCFLLTPLAPPFPPVNLRRMEEWKERKERRGE